MKKIFWIFIVLTLFVTYGCCPKEKGKLTMKTNALLIDVRTLEEYQNGFIAGAVNIPYDEIESEISNFTNQKNKPLYLYCRSGRRSAIAKAALEKSGFQDITDLGSFTDAQKTLQLPIVK